MRARGRVTLSLAHLVGSVQPADLDATDLREPPAPDVLCALGNFAPPPRELVEPHREALLLEPEGALGAHPDPDDDAHRAEAAQGRVEQVRVLVGVARDAHDGRVGEREDEVEEGGRGRDRGERDARAVRRGRDGAGEGLVRDGPERRYGELASLGNDGVEVIEDDAAFCVKRLCFGVDLEAGDGGRFGRAVELSVGRSATMIGGHTLIVVDAHRGPA